MAASAITADRRERAGRGGQRMKEVKEFRGKVMRMFVNDLRATRARRKGFRPDALQHN